MGGAGGGQVSTPKPRSVQGSTLLPRAPRSLFQPPPHSAGAAGLSPDSRLLTTVCSEVSIPKYLTNM